MRKENSLIQKTLSSPIYSSIVTTISIIFAFWIYFESREFRDVSYSFHPIRTEIIKTNRPSRLSISYDDAKIDSTVTTLQMAIWNRGSLPVKREHIQNPILVKTADNSPILEASILKMSRETILDINLNTDDMAHGVIKINWEILEQNDGAVIQITYIGDLNTKFVVSGDIEGQSALTQLFNELDIKNPLQQYKEKLESDFKNGMITLIISLFLLVGIISLKVRTSILLPILNKFSPQRIGLLKQPDKKINIYTESSIKGGLLFYFLFSIGFSMYFLLIKTNPNPPFGF